MPFKQSAFKQRIELFQFQVVFSKVDIMACRGVAGPDVRPSLASIYQAKKSGQDQSVAEAMKQQFQTQIRGKLAATSNENINLHGRPAAYSTPNHKRYVTISNMLQNCDFNFKCSYHS